MAADRLSQSLPTLWVESQPGVANTCSNRFRSLYVSFINPGGPLTVWKRFKLELRQSGFEVYLPFCFGAQTSSDKINCRHRTLIVTW